MKNGYILRTPSEKIICGPIELLYRLPEPALGTDEDEGDLELTVMVDPTGLESILQDVRRYLLSDPLINPTIERNGIA